MKRTFFVSIIFLALSTTGAKSQADPEIDGPSLICKSPMVSTTAVYKYEYHTSYPTSTITYTVQDRAGNSFNSGDLSTSTSGGILTVTIDKNDFDFIVKMTVKEGTSTIGVYNMKSQVGVGDLPTNDMISFNKTPRCGSGSNVTVTIDKENAYGLEYNWTLPLGWTKVEGGTSNRIVAQPNGLNSGTFTCTEEIIGDQFCSGTIYEDVTHPSVSKTISLLSPELSKESPSTSGIAIDYNNTSPLTFTVSSFTSSGELYEWTLPCGWTGPSGQAGTFLVSARTIQVTPNGYSGPGEKVKVRALLSCNGSAEYTNTIEWGISWGSNQSPTISGPSIVCDSNTTFTLQDSPAYSSIIWSQSINLTYVSGQGTANYVVKSNGHAQSGTLTATLSFECDPSLAVTNNLWVGHPDDITGSISGPTSVGKGSVVSYTIPYPQNQSNGTVIWTAPRGFQLWGGGNGYSSASYLVTDHPRTQSGYVQAKKTNACGNGGVKLLYVTVTSGPCNPCPIIIMSPNPATYEVNIEIQPSEENMIVQSSEVETTIQSSEVMTASAAPEEPKITYVLRDTNGKVMLEKTATGSNYTLDLSSVTKSGIYILDVNHNGGLSQFRLQIDR